ncbi:MAG: aspartate ammonia-lyase, partial [Clostridia bacterium]|nr:aspartate ammonia-lyase [Clostridia bacterium]
SIMPGKINPVIPEVVTQAAFLVAGNDVTISMAVEAGQLELNAFEPIVFYCLFQSIDTLGFAVNTFVNNCISGITVNEERCRSMVDRSVSLITALSPYIGYEKCAQIAKEAMSSGRPLRELLVERGLLTQAQLDRLLDPFVLTGPGRVDKNAISGK